MDVNKEIDESRIVRLEKSFETVSDNRFRITMLEERSSQNARSIERAFSDIEKIKESLNDVENKVIVSITRNRFSERVVWMIISGAFGLIGFFISNLIHK